MQKIIKKIQEHTVFNHIYDQIEKDFPEKTKKLSEQEIKTLFEYFITKKTGFVEGKSLQDILVDKTGLDPDILTICSSFDSLMEDIFHVQDKGVRVKLGRYFNKYTADHKDAPASKIYTSFHKLTEQYQNFVTTSKETADHINYTLSIVPKTFAEMSNVSTMGSCLGQDIPALAKTHNVFLGKITNDAVEIQATIILGMDKKTNSLTILNLEPSQNCMGRHTQQQLDGFVKETTEYVRDFATKNNLQLWQYDFKNSKGSNGNYSNKSSIQKGFENNYGTANEQDQRGHSTQVIEYGEPINLRNNSYKFTGGYPLSQPREIIKN